MTPAERARRFLANLREQIRRRALQRDEAALRILGTLTQLEAQLRQTLEATPSAFEAARLPELLREVEGQIKRWTDRALGVAQATLSAAWELGPALVEGPLAAAGLRIGASILPRSLLEEASRFTANKIQGIGPRALARIDAEIQRLVLGGQTPTQAMRAISADLKDEHVGWIGFRSETVVRTEAGRLHSLAADRRLQDAARQIPGLGKQWLWSRKSRATHQAANGQIRPAAGLFDVGGERLPYPRAAGASPANTINCGCESVPYMARWQ